MYKLANDVRALQSHQAMSEMMVKASLVKATAHPPYPKDLEPPVLLDAPAACISFDLKWRVPLFRQARCKTRVQLSQRAGRGEVSELCCRRRRRPLYVVSCLVASYGS